MSLSRRPRVSIDDYPEHLNPFSEEITNAQPQIYRDEKTKDSKHKFWTFGRSRKKRSNSFYMKLTCSGLFGKKKEAPEVEQKRSTITTVSSTYKREPTVKPMVPPRTSKDQQEFDEAFGTLARRRKYTLDNSSRYSSSLTVNGDPARIYDGSPQNTTASIMGDLTPKPPARRFGQVSPKPTDKIPPLDFEDRSPKENGTVTLREKSQERTPVPPLRRFGNRSSQRTIASNLDPEDEACRSGDVALCDENENVPEDYVFKRFSQDAVRRSNLSINSCVSIGSTASTTYRRKKRRAPQPPRRVEHLDTTEENDVQKPAEVPGIELHIIEPIDITSVTENIDEMTRNSQLNEPASEENQSETAPETVGKLSEAEKKDSPSNETSREEDERDGNVESLKQPESTKEDTAEQPSSSRESATKEESNVQIEYRRTSQDNVEIIKDVDQVNSEDVQLRRKGSSSTLSRSDSFSVKEEIEKIEKQIKVLEMRNASRDSANGEAADELCTKTRNSIEANRRHFFQNMVDAKSEKDGIKIEFRELPREQKDIHVVRLTDAPVTAPRESVKVIELHISEPIKQKPEIVDDVNPIPKPRRNSGLSLNGSQTNIVQREEARRGQSF